MSDAITAYRRNPAPSPLAAHIERPQVDETKVRRLSDRERQVLSHFAQGRSTKSVARILAISPRTVDAYSAVIVQKLRARNRIHAVAIAFRMGLIATEERPEIEHD